jgi:DNA-binding LacI/PurR family transcriptional regulator
VANRRSGHVTLRDVAQACGFAVSTVSIVLSEAPLSLKVAASTRELIRVTARQMGYYPDAYARTLRRRRSQTIGVLAFDLSDPFCIPTVRGIQAGLQKANYLSLLIDAQTQRGLFDNYLRRILERRVEGVIVIANWIFEETNLLADIEKNIVPVVIVGRDLTARGISSVLVDNDAGGELGMRHLLELGHRRIAVIRGPKELFDSEPRWAGQQRAAAEAGVRFDSKLVFQLPGAVDPKSGFEGGLNFSRQMLASGRHFTAVLAFDDLTALGVVRGLTEAGLRIPEDCSVLGFDDVLPSAVSTPGITTIRQPLKEMGLQAAQWMIEALEQKIDQKPRLCKTQPEMVVRMSSTRPARQKTKKNQEKSRSLTDQAGMGDIPVLKRLNRRGSPRPPKP